MPSFTDERPNFEIQVVSEGGVSTVAVSGDLDLATVGEFDTALRDQLARQPVRLDLARLTFLDSAGIHALDAVVRDLEPNGWQLRIAPALQDAVRQILEITSMIGVLPFEADEDP
jgi:anti-anti-sigma factor